MKQLNPKKQPSSPSHEHTHNPFLFLQKEMNRMMNDFFSLFEKSSEDFDDLGKLALNPSLDVIEDDKNFKVEVEMPGMGKEDIQVFVKDHVLSIHGEKTISKKDSGKHYISREIGYGHYEREFMLPDDIEATEATASFKKGMLWINFPKKSGAEATPHEIKIDLMEA